HRRALHSFPTRRSSDLTHGVVRTARGTRGLPPADIHMVDTEVGRSSREAPPASRRSVSARSSRRRMNKEAEPMTVYAFELRFSADRKSTRLNSSHVKIS